MKNQKGFTLMELVVVIVIIGILAAIAVPKLMNLGTSAQTAACKQNRENIKSAVNVVFSQWVLAGNSGDFNAWVGDVGDVPTGVSANFPGGNVPGCPSGANDAAADYDFSDRDAAGLNQITCNVVAAHNN